MAGQIDVCSKLTPAEIQQAVGLQVGPGEAKELDGLNEKQPACDWEAVNYEYLMVAFHRDAGKCDEMRQRFEGTPSVDGLDGPGTWYTSLDGDTWNLCVFNGGKPFTVYSFIDPPTTLPNMVALAKLVQSRS